MVMRPRVARKWLFVHSHFRGCFKDHYGTTNAGAAAGGRAGRPGTADFTARRAASRRPRGRPPGHRRAPSVDQDARRASRRQPDRGHRRLRPVVRRRVGVEEPGYPAARAVFAAHGLRVVPCPVDSGGLRVDALPDGLRLVYATPAHQYPLGARLSVPRRRALTAWARDTGALIVEDDY